MNIAKFARNGASTLEILRYHIFIWAFLMFAGWQAQAQGQTPDSSNQRFQVLDSILKDTNNTPSPAPPTKRQRVEIVNADRHTFSSADRPTRAFLGNVHLRQDTTDFYCDTAYHYTDSNMLYAKGNVRIVLRDSLSITSDRLEYNANTQVADLFGDIHMRNRKTELVTPRMTFYRKQDYGKYFNGGVLYDGDNELRSYSGYYFTGDELAFFKGNVVLINPKYTLTTDTLGYDTHSESAIFNAPTLILDKDDNTIYTERGFYDTKMNLAYFYRNPYLQDSTYRLQADTIFYDRDMDFGRALGNLVLTKSDSSISVYGNYGEFKQFESVSYLTDSAYALQKLEGDTLYVFADTLFAYQDSIFDKTGDTLKPYNMLFAYYNVNFFMNDLQGKTDSLVYFLDDSTIHFYKKPMLWADLTQVIGDTVKVMLSNKLIDSMAIGKEALIVTQEDTVGFNQVKGKWILTKFKDNKISRMWVLGNSESIYFAKDEEKGYTGMNQARCSQMFIRFTDNEVSRISFIDQAEGTFSPMHTILFEKNQLDGFRWDPELRPLKPAGLFKGKAVANSFETEFRDSILKNNIFRDTNATKENEARDSSLVPDDIRRSQITDSTSKPIDRRPLKKKKVKTQKIAKKILKKEKSAKRKELKKKKKQKLETDKEAEAFPVLMEKEIRKLQREDRRRRRAARKATRRKNRSKKTKVAE